MFDHLRARQRLPLLAGGGLDEPARRATLAHVASCSSCARELGQLEATLSLLRRDPLPESEPPLPLPALLSRVDALLDERGWEGARSWPIRPVLALTSLVASAVVAAVAFWPGGAPPGTEAPVVSEDTLSRLERNMAREQAARYLGEAQDVLVSVAAAPRPCDRERVDLGQASERSRQLLTRGTLLVDPDEEAVASARPVLNDVEDALREVAALESCVRPRDVRRLQEDLARRQLLMKIRLMKRELEG